MTRNWTAGDLAAIAQRNGARKVDRNLGEEPLRLREAIGQARVAKPATETRQQAPVKRGKAKRNTGEPAEYRESDGERMLIQQMKVAGITDWRREFMFCEGRKWRLDFAWLAVKLAVEVEGGTFSSGRHVRGIGFAKDCEKYNELTLAGWRLLRFTTEMVKRGEAVQPITDMLCRLAMANKVDISA